MASLASSMSSLSLSWTSLSIDCTNCSKSPAEFYDSVDDIENCSAITHLKIKGEDQDSDRSKRIQNLTRKLTNLSHIIISNSLLRLDVVSGPNLPKKLDWLELNQCLVIGEDARGGWEGRNYDVPKLVEGWMDDTDLKLVLWKHVGYTFSVAGRVWRYDPHLFWISLIDKFIRTYR